MPFESEAQRRWAHATHQPWAHEWEHETPKRKKKNLPYHKHHRERGKEAALEAFGLTKEAWAPLAAALPAVKAGLGAAGRWAAGTALPWLGKKLFGSGGIRAGAKTIGGQAAVNAGMNAGITKATGGSWGDAAHAGAVGGAQGAVFGRLGMPKAIGQVPG